MVLAAMAASGGVAAINEIVRSPKLATALQSIIEDGEISIPTPEGGTYKIPAERDLHRHLEPGLRRRR
jgi:hypothetical protein